MEQQRIPTTLGYPLIERETDWMIDLSELKIFRGLSVLAGVIGEIIIDRSRKNAGDISFLYKISSNINPELIALNIHHIQVYGRIELLSDIVSRNGYFIDHLVTALGTLQRSSWRYKLHPDEESADPHSISTALVFPFSYPSRERERSYHIILERAVVGEKTEGFFFRLSFQDQNQGVINLSNIPHIIVDDLKNRVYISGSTRMAESVKDAILNACNRGLKEYSEENRNHSHLFEQLKKTKLGRLEKMRFNWDSDFSRSLCDESETNTRMVFKKLFLSFEADSICDTLTRGGTITVKLKWCHVTLFLSQLNRVLNVNINLPRDRYRSGMYLRRMPLLESTARKKGHSLDFSSTGIFLIHHITSEIVAFIEALRELNADSLNTLFVKYGGVVPAEYLDTLLEIPPDFLLTAGLVRKTTQTHRNYFTLCDYLHDTQPMSRLGSVLERERLDFFPAMRLVAGHMFLRFCLRKQRENRRVLLIEDGGYLAPLLNELAISGKTTAQVFERFFVEEPPPSGEVSGWLSNILIGTIEHTRNGYDRLEAVQKNASQLAFPAFSIAISRDKRTEESQEVSHSILSAIESILHGHGLVLSKRRVVLLGGNGAIGHFLRQHLENGRLHPNALPLINVDIKTNLSHREGFKTVDDIPNADLLDVDLFIGVTGVSLLRKETIERIVLEGTKQTLFFASGSTKTVEFSHLSEWLGHLFAMERPLIGETPVSIEYDRLIDPQSRIDQGGKVTIQFSRGTETLTKQLLLLNDLTPVNFLYYGVPTETMDLILNQLLKVSLGMVALSKGGETLPPALYAVDYEIDEWGKLK